MPIDEVIAIAAVVYVCVLHWEEIKGVWKDICQIVGVAVEDDWYKVEEQIAKAQRADENKKTKTDAYEKPGKKKPKVQLEMVLERAEKKGGVYSVVKREYIPTVNYLKNYELVYTAKTGHYKLRCNIKPVSVKDKIINTSLNNRYWCINRTGHIWKWNYRDNDAPNNSVVVKMITEPDADYPNKKKEERPSNLISNYKNEYFKAYNKTLNWSANTYDVHHIQPLFCYGVNDFYNLIHLPKKHHGHILDWFGGYF